MRKISKQNKLIIILTFIMLLAVSLFSSLQVKAAFDSSNCASQSSNTCIDKQGKPRCLSPYSESCGKDCTRSVSCGDNGEFRVGECTCQVENTPQCPVATIWDGLICKGTAQGTLDETTDQNPIENGGEFVAEKENKKNDPKTRTESNKQTVSKPNSGGTTQTPASDIIVIEGKPYRRTESGCYNAITECTQAPDDSHTEEITCINNDSTIPAGNEGYNAGMTLYCEEDFTTDTETVDADEIEVPLETDNDDTNYMLSEARNYITDCFNRNENSQNFQLIFDHNITNPIYFTIKDSSDITISGQKILSPIEQGSELFAQSDAESICDSINEIINSYNDDQSSSLNFFSKARAQVNPPTPELIDPELLDSGVYILNIPNFETAEVKIYSNNVKVKYFIDKNGDGKKQEDEEYIDISQYEVRIEKQASIQKYDFEKGWNLIALPIVSNDLNTAQKFIDYLNSKGIDAIQISTYRDDKWIHFVRRTDEANSTVYFGTDFSLIPGNGYFINTVNKGEVYLEGNRIIDSVPIFFQSGWNLIGIISPNFQYSAKSFLEKCNENAAVCLNINEWINGTNYYESFELFGTQYFGNDFQIEEEKGYFVEVISETTLNP